MATTGMKLAVGHSYGEFYLNRYAGVNPATGDPLWYDKNGEVTPVMNESDKVLVGHSYIAPWQGGFGTVVSWKGLSLGAQFSWVADRWMINNDRYFEENTTFDNYNLSRRMLYDRWKQAGDVTSIPRYGVTPQFDTHLLENASFLRLNEFVCSVIHYLRPYLSAQKFYLSPAFMCKRRISLRLLISPAWIRNQVQMCIRRNIL